MTLVTKEPTTEPVSGLGVSVTDESGSSTTSRSPIPSDDTARSPELRNNTATNNRTTVNETLRKRSEDALRIKHGNAQYGETVQFHTFELFRHGSRQVQSRSVGYSSEGDLVLYKDEYALAVSDSELAVSGVAIDGAVCLNPAARRPLSDVEATLEAKKIKGSRFKKYPGVRCPKNRKIRNRLMNDHFATAYAKKLQDACVDFADIDAALEMEEFTRPTFPTLTKHVHQLVVHVDEDKERQELQRRGVYSTPPLAPATNPIVVDVNSGDYRFNQLNSRLKDELKNALGSEFLTQQIVDLEAYFADYIRNPPVDDQPMIFQFRDGYGRLVCHGVAAYYNLVSKSEEAHGAASVVAGGAPKSTIVSFPKKGGRCIELPTSTLVATLQRRQGRSPVLAGAPSPILVPFNLDDPVVYSEKHVDAAILHAKTQAISATQKKKLRKTMKELAIQAEQDSESLPLSRGDSKAAAAARKRNGRRPPERHVQVSHDDVM